MHHLEAHDDHVAANAPAPAAVPLDFGELVRALGYRLADAPPGEPSGPRPRPPLSPQLGELAATVLARGQVLLEPAWHWRLVPVALDGQDDLVQCDGTPPVALDVGRLIRGQLRGSEAIAGFVVTIGPRLEVEARRLLSGGQPLEGYILDAVGSLAVEAVADQLQAEVAAQVAARGWKHTNRFSPGYCTWETAGQQALFALFPENPAGVSLSPSSLMTPLKSISGLFGLGPDVDYRPYQCDLCSMTTCQQRLTEARL